MTIVKINGMERHLFFSVNVMFEVTDKYHSVQEALEKIAVLNREGFDVLRYLTVAMANEGELIRREEGFDHLPFITAKDFSLHTRPEEFERVRTAVLEAITEGYRREELGEEEETDLGLEELNKGKKPKAGA